MPKIVDPDALTEGVEIVFDTGSKTIQLLVAGNLDDDAPGSTSGVTLQAVYSFCKLEWKDDADLNRLRFPFDAITATKMDLVNSWIWADAQTQDLIRDGGWSVRSIDGYSMEEYMSIISLGGSFISGSDLAYYQGDSGFNQPTTEFDKSDQLNEPVLIFDSGSVNNRDFFKIFLREEGKTYAEGNLLTDQNLSALDYTVYKLPLVNSVDIKITNTDEHILTGSEYTELAIDYLRGSRYATWASGSNPTGSYEVDEVMLDTGSSPSRWFRAILAHSGSDYFPVDDPTNWEPYIGEFQIGDNYYAFNRVVSGSGTGGATLETIYEWVQWKLRSGSDINDNTLEDDYGGMTGSTAVQLASFLGDTLQSNPGTMIAYINANDVNRIQLFDITVDTGGLNSEDIPSGSTARTYPFVSAGTIVFNSVITSDPNAEFTMYFTNDDAGDDLGRDFDTTSAIIVNDSEGNPITDESVTGDVVFSYDYDGNTQRGAASAGTPAPVTIVAMGLSGSQWVASSFTITEATGLTFPVNSSLERNYSNT